MAESGVHFAKGFLTWGALAGEASRKLERLRKRLEARPTAYVCRSQREALEAVSFCLAENMDFIVLPAEVLKGVLRERLTAEGYGILDYAGLHLTDPPKPRPFTPGRVSLLTSGSTGAPKRIEHRAETLQTFTRLTHPCEGRWLLLYQVGTYAWYQMVFLGRSVQGVDLVAPSGMEPEILLREAAEMKVTAVSATPTFWRTLFLRASEKELRRFPLKQVTLGGERVDQALLDALAALYPAARITQIYASAEAGACIVVSDGREGFPAGYLTREGEVRLRIRGEELEVLSPHASTQGAGRWVSTGDRVERSGDRIRFVGRSAGTLINVGGKKANPADIERVLYLHPAVLWCRVEGVKAAFTGFLPKAQVVLRERQQAGEAALVAHCQGQLPEHAVPRFWEFLKEVPLSDNLKSG